MKRRLSSLLDSLRERIVLTPEEKRVLCFVLAAFFLGVTVKYYRDAHREPSLPAEREPSQDSPCSDRDVAAAEKNTEKTAKENKRGHAIRRI